MAALLALREHGHRVINLACGLGRPEQEGRRRAELEAACSLAGFELRIADPAARDDEERLKGWWEGLSEGATVEMELAKAPWGDWFGSLTDRFGIEWMVNITGSGS